LSLRREETTGIVCPPHTSENAGLTPSCGRWIIEANARGRAGTSAFNMPRRQFRSVADALGGAPVVWELCQEVIGNSPHTAF
jgi:hypothetical protein